jgi:rhomboid family GlyGly-CTERM serine protease
MIPHASDCPTFSRQSDICLQQLRHWINNAWKHYGFTAAIAFVTIVIFAFPKLTTCLQLDFNSVADGQWWRLITGHLTHYNAQHLFWDLLMFVVLGAMCERPSKKMFGVFFAFLAIGVSVTVTLACNDISEYRGLSGIDTGLFVWLIIDQLRTSFAGRDRYGAIFWSVGGLLLVGKLAFEMVSGNVLFVQTDGFKPLLESHLAGAAGGAIVALASAFSRKTA